MSKVRGPVFGLMKKRVLVPAAIFLALFLLARAYYQPPILMYHHVGDPSAPKSLNVSTKTFERQMEFLKAHRYNVIPLAELVAKVRRGEPFPKNTVVITFDDGYLDNFTNAFPILKKMNFPASIFMITGFIGREGFLSEEDLRILDTSKIITLGSHTVNHAFIPKLSREEIVFELHESKRSLEGSLFHPVTLFSYPAGGVTDDAEILVQDAGYEGAVTTNYRSSGKDPYALRRIKVSEANGSLFNFWAKVSGFYHLGKKSSYVEKSEYRKYYEGEALSADKGMGKTHE